jgi:hypothetical protein
MAPSKAPTSATPVLLPVERTYVLKLAEGGQPGELTGRLEHVLSGRQLDFRNARQLMAALRQAGAAGGPDA